MIPELLDAFSATIRVAGEPDFACTQARPLSGGCINRAYRLESADGRRYFVKLNLAAKQSMFEAEYDGLHALAASRTIRVPHPVGQDCAAGQAFLILEYLDLQPRGDARKLGEQLAALHRTSAPQFGWLRDNTLGETPQPNGRTTDWIAFWRDQRLGYQLKLAKRNGYGYLLSNGERLLESLPVFFEGYRPQPSLLHGDLWGGNHAYLPGGVPVIFDPAPYFGDRETDLAMTELFGGYSADFYAAYRAHWPLDAGYAQRRELYNLYHILNHANLFGSGYARQADDMMQRLLAAIR
ncbi:MAG: fructosamine kinase family protein [Pseudomonadota bacterium]